MAGSLSRSFLYAIVRLAFFSIPLSGVVFGLSTAFYSCSVWGALPDYTPRPAFFVASAREKAAPTKKSDKKSKAARQISGSPWPGIIDHILQIPYPDISSPGSKVQISINYPSVGNGEIDSDIRDWVSQIANAFESHLNIMPGLDNMEGGDWLDSAEQDMDAPKFELFGNYTVSHPSRNAISLTFELWNYSGASQGNLDIMTLNYSKLSGKRLDLVDIFEDPEAALKIMSEFSRKALQTRLGAARHTHTLLSGTEPLAENFASLTLTPGGICINFQPYQVAPWSAGIQKVEMPLEELALAKPMLALWDRS